MKSNYSDRQDFPRPWICGLVLLLWIGTTTGRLSAQTLLTTQDDVPSLAAEAPLLEASALETVEYGQSELDVLRARLDTLEELLRKPPPAPKPATDPLKPTLKWSMEVQVDSIWAQQTPGNRAAVGDIQDGVDFRRARIAAFGDLYKNVEYRMEFDFAQSGRPTFLDNWVAFHQVPIIGNLKIGHFFEPFSLERMTSNRYMVFMERSLADTFAPARNTGISGYDMLENERMTWAYGVYRPGADDFGDDVGDNGEWAGTGRITGLPWYECDGLQLLHLGLAYSYRGADEGVFRFRERPEIRDQALGEGDVPRFVDTGNILARSSQLFGVEAAAVYNSFSIQSEYIATKVDRLDGPNVMFQGAYVYGSYFLTGEHRNYKQSTGTFDRIQTLTNVLQPSGISDIPTGWGAWELAFRWSYLDLNNQDIRGGRLHDLTAGLNWYLNPYTRVTLNYIHPLLDDPALGHSHADIFGMRMGFEY